MAFNTVKLIQKTHSHAEATGVSVGLVKLRSAKALTRITLTKRGFEESGWKANDQIGLQIGTGEHAGLIRLVPMAPGARLAVKTLKNKFAGEVTLYTLNLGHRPEFPDIAFKAAPVQWEALSGGVMEITLPDWKPKSKTVTREIHGTLGETEAERQHRENCEREKRMGLR
jgi:hypothetical protein